MTWFYDCLCKACGYSWVDMHSTWDHGCSETCPKCKSSDVNWLVQPMK